MTALPSPDPARVLADALAATITAAVRDAVGRSDDGVPAVLDVEGASRYLGVHVDTVRRLCTEGRLPGLKVGREWRLSRRAVDEALGGSR